MRASRCFSSPHSSETTSCPVTTGQETWVSVEEGDRWVMQSGNILRGPYTSLEIARQTTRSRQRHRISILCTFCSTWRAFTPLATCIRFSIDDWKYRPEADLLDLEDDLGPAGQAVFFGTHGADLVWVRECVNPPPLQKTSRRDSTHG